MDALQTADEEEKRDHREGVGDDAPDGDCCKAVMTGAVCRDWERAGQGVGWGKGVWQG